MRRYIFSKLGVFKRLDRGENRREVLRPDFNRSLMIDFHGARITADVGFLLVRQADERFKIIEPRQDCLEDLRLSTRTKARRRRSLPRDRGSPENQPYTKIETTYWTKAEPLTDALSPTFGEPPVPVSRIIFWPLVIEPFTVAPPLRVTESF